MDKQLLKPLKEFWNMVETYELWEKQNGAQLIYQSFWQCLGGSARDIWDQVNVIDNEEERDELMFEEHLWSFTD
jgi:hypothetical protein